MRAAVHLMPGPLRRRLRTAARTARRSLRRRRRARWGNLRRHAPFSDRYGFDRGTPIDRHYLHRYFADNAAHLTGQVLEVRDPAYTAPFGRSVTSVDLLDIDPTNLDATVVADLAEPGSLPSSSYDCVVVPQTIHLVDDPSAAIANAWQALRPGGSVLITVPCVSRRVGSLGDLDRWRFMPAGLHTLLARECPGGDVAVVGFGNLVACIASLLGLAAEELESADLDPFDPAHPLLACGRATKPRQ